MKTSTTLRWLTLSGALLLALFLAPTARAQVLEATASGFQVKITERMAAPPERVYASLVDVGGWWDSEHTYSGSARNMKLDPRPGGCWCETLPGGGGVLHMTVANVMPNKRLVLTGGLGPLQTAGVAGAMSWQLTPRDGGTEVVVTYNVGGYMPGGLSAIATGVDGVLHEQVERLKRLVETGNPAAVAAKK